MSEENQAKGKSYLPRTWDSRRRRGKRRNQSVETASVSEHGPNPDSQAPAEQESGEVGQAFEVHEGIADDTDSQETIVSAPECTRMHCKQQSDGPCCLEQQAECEPERPTGRPQIKVTVQVCGIRFGQASRIYHFDTAGVDLEQGDWVIVKTEKGTGLGYVAVHSFEKEFEPAQLEGLRKVLRKAGQTDFDQWKRCRQREKDAHTYCMERIAELGLPMKLVAAECFFDSSKYIFYFTAEGRVDFRELVKQLVSRFPVRIEMRQIGVRHEAKMIGGLATCGQELCCARFLTDFKPVSVRMAKTQNLSLNPTKISGVCGRLMCCLGYEHGIYEDFRKGLPKIGKTVKTRKGEGVVVKHNPLTETVFLKVDEETNIEVRREDVLEGWASVSGADMFDLDDHDDSDSVDFLLDEP